MNTAYVTIWSKSDSSQWVIERTHTKDYCKCIIGVSEIGETVTINGRHYGTFAEGVNPNKINLPVS